ncbi:MAG: bifunctional riboflavin kinase/FAD synthetase [Chloroflexi bacterium]|nr:bifunctional riboflavin kinase/FAD synthetase [Chloroflexota bacterium]
MQVVTSLQDFYATQDSVVTIGSFDGFHRGHLKLVNKVIERARRTDRQAVMVTLYPHPRKVLTPDKDLPLLNTLEEKLAVLEKSGLDTVIVFAFTPETLRLTAEAFCTLLVTHLRMRELWVGPDFALGYKRQGDIPTLQKIGEALEFTVGTVLELELDGTTVRSSRIREALNQGNLTAVTYLLGRPYSARGTVIAGARRGRDLGFPTANLQLPQEKCLPPNGIYVVKTVLDGWIYPGVANVGVRPTFDNGERLVEVYLLDFNQNIYGKEIEVQFVEYLREERKYTRLEDLIAQIHLDVLEGRRSLAPVFQEISHTADVGLLVKGRYMAELFANAAAGMAWLMFGPTLTREDMTENARSPATTGQDAVDLVEMQSPDSESLLVDWLSELLYRFDTTGEIWRDVSVLYTSPYDPQEATESRFEARVRFSSFPILNQPAGTPVADTLPAEHNAPIRKAIKAVTFHNLQITETAEGVEATIIFDI